MKRALKTIAAALCMAPLIAFGAESTGSTPPPPWLMTGTHGIEVGYVLDEKQVRELLPLGIEPAKELSGGFELYVSPGGYGLAPYSAFNMFVDVDGIDMPDGRKGRWMLIGNYGPSEQVAQALRQHYGYPITAGSARGEQKGDEWIWTGSAQGSDFIEVRVRRKGTACEMHTALDHWPAKSPAGPIVVNEIPNTYCWRDVELVSVKLLGRPHETVTALQPGNKPIAYAVEWENGAWSFTRPVPKR